ncbi:MAG: hypothetical protein WA005_19160 [Candidatus Binataceae bacterium]
MAMEGLPLGPVREVFQIVEERIPFGRVVTTVASSLIVFAIIVFCAVFVLSTIGSVFGHIGISWPHGPSWAWVFGVGFSALCMFAAFATFKAIQADSRMTSRQIDRDKQMIQLLEEIRDGLSKRER